MTPGAIPAAAAAALRARRGGALALAALALAACQSTPPAALPGSGPGSARAPLPASAARYQRETGPLPLAIADADWLAAWPAWLASCRFLASARNAQRAAWDGVCTESIFYQPRSGAEVRAFFTGALDRYQVIAREPAVDGAAVTETQTGLMTGYYEPELEGSRSRSAQFSVPLYGAPAAPVTAPRASLAADGAMQGRELLWVHDPVDAFFLEVQGSGRIHLRDDGWVRVAYAGSNGQPYRSIGRWLVEQGELVAGQVSQAAIRDWAAAHPERVRALLEQNPRVVFFRELPPGDPAAGPVGSIGVALTPGVSVAVDPRFLPLGAPLLIDTRMPGGDEPLTRAALAQDTGAAIRGPLRIDWFWGLGAAAAERAGRQHAPGSVRLLVPRGVAPERLLPVPSG